jgi:Leucine-rich repeat (LRR) protein
MSFSDHLFARRLLTTSRATSLILSLLLVAGCERYAVTLNQQPIYTPKVIYSGYQIADAALSNCVKLTLAEAKVTKPEQLETLNCSFAGVTDLSGIELFSQLKTINLNSNQLTDIKALLFLSELRQVNLTENPSLSCIDVAALNELLKDAIIAAPVCNKVLLR